MLEIPLKNGLANARQTFSTPLSGQTFAFTLQYVDAGGRPAWSCDIEIDGARVASGVMLEPGVNLLAHYPLVTSGALWFVGGEATLDNLGAANHLVWVSADE